MTKYTRRGQNEVDIVMGFQRKNQKDLAAPNYGLLLYHNNRLIRAFEKMGYQKHSVEKGRGVVAVVEADYLEPTHNKQDFNRDDNHKNLCFNITTAMNDYWDVYKSGTGTLL